MYRTINFFCIISLISIMCFSTLSCSKSSKGINSVNNVTAQNGQKVDNSIAKQVVEEKYRGHFITDNNILEIYIDENSAATYLVKEGINDRNFIPIWTIENELFDNDKRFGTFPDSNTFILDPLIMDYTQNDPIVYKRK